MIINAYLEEIYQTILIYPTFNGITNSTST